MRDELTYVLITPYSMFKSRTGNIVARVLSETGLDLVGARIYCPGRAMAKAYASCFPASSRGSRDIRSLLRNYILDNFVLKAGQKRYRHVMVLLLRGPNAVSKMAKAAGELRPNDLYGDTLRGTYGSLLRDRDGNVLFVEPAVMVPENRKEAARHLKVFARFAESDGGICRNWVTPPKGVNIERTMVMIKPENFVRPSRRPGSILDVLSRSGLSILACKVHHMSLEEAERFYGPNRPILRRIYTERMSVKAPAILEKELGFRLTAKQAKDLGKLLGPPAGDDQFDRIVGFMSGVDPKGVTAAQRRRPGPAKVLVLVYEGKDAVSQVRKLLGTTNPAKAQFGTIRAEFGQSIMVNAAHASDSVKNARREMGILRPGENNIRPVIEKFFGKTE